MPEKTWFTYDTLKVSWAQQKYPFFNIFSRYRSRYRSLPGRSKEAIYTSTENNLERLIKNDLNTCAHDILASERYYIKKRYRL